MCEHHVITSHQISVFLMPSYQRGVPGNYQGKDGASVI